MRIVASHYSETVQTWVPLTPAAVVSPFLDGLHLNRMKGTRLELLLLLLLWIGTWFNLFRVVWRLMLTRVWWCMEAKKNAEQQGEGRKSAYVMWRNLRVVKWAFWCLVFYCFNLGQGIADARPWVSFSKIYHLMWKCKIRIIGNGNSNCTFNRKPIDSENFSMPLFVILVVNSLLLQSNIIIYKYLSYKSCIQQFYNYPT